MENCCMEQGDAVLSAPAWQFRMLHLAHRTATDALLDKYGVRDCGHPFILFLLEHCGSDGLRYAKGALAPAQGLARLGHGGAQGP